MKWRSWKNYFRGSTSPKKPRLSIVVIVYDMHREGLRTLWSLSPAYQKGIEADQYEVLLIDNGSPEPFPAQEVRNLGPNFHYFYIEDASPSPSEAINFAVEKARADSIGIMIDGARMLSPGVLYWALRGIDMFSNPVISVLGFHLGAEHQRESVKKGYCKQVEDNLLDAIDWQNNGYRLFEIASLAGSCQDGWFDRIAESNCCFLSKALFQELGGFDERFQRPGGGLVNLDFYKRATEWPSAETVYLMGEGCFHQLHGGVTTGGGGGRPSKVSLTLKKSIFAYMVNVMRCRITGRFFWVKALRPPYKRFLMPAKIICVARALRGQRILSRNLFMNKEKYIVKWLGW